MLLGLRRGAAAGAVVPRLLRVRAARRAELAALGLVAPAAATTGWRRHAAPGAAPGRAGAAGDRRWPGRRRWCPQPRREGTVILAFDVSASMAAPDLAPTRMEAAKAAARTFVQRQPPTVRVGVVAFSGSGLVTQEPTSDRAARARGDRPAQPAGRHGARRRPADLAERHRRAAGAGDGAEPARSSRRARTSATTARRRSCCCPTARTPTTPDPLDVAELASSAGVRVYPIGLGRPAGHGAGDRRLPGRDRARRAAAARDRGADRRHATSRPPTSRRWRPCTTPSS